jgi:hypothetical protein
MPGNCTCVQGWELRPQPTRLPVCSRVVFPTFIRGKQKACDQLLVSRLCFRWRGLP